MHLIIGGAYQGKLTWVKTTYNIAEHETLDLTQNDPIPGYRCYLHLEALTRRDEHPERWLPVLESAIVLAREIGDSLGVPSYIVDPVVVDELTDKARISGMPRGRSA